MKHSILTKRKRFVSASFFVDIYKSSPSIHALIAQRLSELLNLLPVFHFVESGQDFLRTSSVFPMPLEPEVAKGITVLPEKS